jgi:hypothetical protein
MMRARTPAPPSRRRTHQLLIEWTQIEIDLWFAQSVVRVLEDARTAVTGGWTPQPRSENRKIEVAE